MYIYCFKYFVTTIPYMNIQKETYKIMIINHIWYICAPDLQKLAH